MKKFLAYEHTDENLYVEHSDDGNTEYYEDIVVTQHFIRLLDEAPSFAKVIGNQLFLGDIEVPDYSIYGDLGGDVPCLYTIKVKSEGTDYFSFESGFDLLEDGRVWVGSIDTEDGGRTDRQHFSSFQSAINHINAHIKVEWILTLEEPML